MGSEQVFLYFLEDFSDRDIVSSASKDIDGLFVKEGVVSLDDFLALGANARPSIILSSPTTIRNSQESIILQVLVDSGHQFIIITDVMEPLPDFITQNPESFASVQRPLEDRKLRPMIHRAKSRIDWRSTINGTGFRCMEDKDLSEAFLNIYEQVSDPVLLIGLKDSKILKHNEAARQNLGMGISMEGEDLLMFSHQPDRTQSALQNRTPYTADRILRRRDGRLVMSSVHCTFYKSRTQDLALVVIKDLTPDSNLRSELRRRQRLFQEVLDSIATPILQISFDPSRILFVNKATVEKLGFSRQKLMDSDPGQLFSGNAEMMRLLLQRGSFLHEISMLDGHGQRRFMEVKAQFIEEGQDSRFIVNLHDVTERQELLEAQEYNLKRLQEAQRLAKVGSWSYEQGWAMPLFSPEACALHGFDVDSLSQEGFADMVEWEDREEIRPWLEDMLSGSKPHPLRYTIRDKDGLPRYFVMHAELVHDDNGTVIGLTGTSQDISEIELLQQKNTLYLQTFDLMDLEMVFFSEDGHIVECNDAFALKRGMPKVSLKGRHVSILNPRYTTESWPRFWDRVNRQGFERREEIHKRDDGSDYDVLVSVSLMDYLGQKMVLAIITDITELKTYQKQLQRSLKEKTALLQEVHHRVGNNLQTISSFVSLKSIHSPSEEVQTYLEDINDRIMGIAAIHNSMYEQQRFLDLELLQHLQTVWNNSFQIIHGGHDIDISGDAVFIDINRALPLSLVVSELFSNSLHHAFDGQKGSMELRLRDLDGSLSIHYRDDGKGYNEEDLRGGLGKVGLTLMKNLVERQLKGSIRFYNQGGANAEIVLPKGFFNRSIRDPLSENNNQ